MSKAATTVALMINTSDTSTPVYSRICKSTQLTIAMNPETEDFDYIADASKTTEVKSYAPTIEQDLAIIKGEPDYEFVYKRYKKAGIGKDAHINTLVIYMLDGDNTNGYYAEKWDAVMTFTDYNAVDGKLNFTLAFCGTKEVGTATIANKAATFTPEASTD